MCDHENTAVQLGAGLDCRPQGPERVAGEAEMLIDVKISVTERVTPRGR
jgi:hypothetical protein